MPAGVDERLWKKAKRRAAEQGKAEEWDYVMGIYQTMTSGKHAPHGQHKSAGAPSMNNAKEDIDNLLWRAIEGGLGAEKAAALRTRSLSELTGVTSISVGMGKLATSAQTKKANWRKIHAGLKEAVALEKERPPVPRGIHEGKSMERKLASARKLRVLEASDLLSDEDRVKVAALRGELDKEIFGGLVHTAVGQTKTAANPLAGTPTAPAERWLADAMKNGAGTLGKGLLMGTGAAVPLTVGGMAVADHSAEEMRNQALLAAAAVGGLGAAGYGIHSAMQGEKLSTLTQTVYLDQLLSRVDQTEKVSALREMNRDLGVSVLLDLEKTAADMEAQLPPEAAAGFEQMAMPQAAPPPMPMQPQMTQGMPAPRGPLPDTVNTPASLHAYNALLDQLGGGSNAGRAYHPSFGKLPPVELWSMVSPTDRERLTRLYPSAGLLSGAV